jgi:hypothetical protein
VVFCRGFCEKRMFDRGFFVVETWWLGGETWCFDSQFFGLEKCDMFPEFIFWRSRFGNAEMVFVMREGYRRRDLRRLVLGGGVSRFAGMPTSQDRDMGHPARSPRSETFVEGMNKPMGAF